MHFADTATDGITASLGAWLRPRLPTAATVAIRTGFLTVAGLRDLAEPLLEVLDRGGRIYIITGGNPDQADPAALTELLRMSQNADGALTVHLVPEPVFHNAKLYYLAHEDGRVEAWVGSANFTRPGLATNHEAGITLDSTSDPGEVLDDIYASVLSYMSTDSAAEPLTAEHISTLLAHSPTRPAAATRKRALGTTETLGAVLQPTVDEVDAVASRTGHSSGLPTGFTDLDALTGGLRPGTLTVLASRPSVGRSTLAMDICRSVAVKQKLPAAFFTAAASTVDLAHRLLAAESRIRLGDMRTGRMTDDDWTRFARRMSELDGTPVHFNASSAPTVDELCAEITRLRDEQDVQLAVIDPLSAITATTEPGASREREVAATMRRLKALALDLNLPLVLTAELGRVPEHRIGKKPQLSDLRESDTIHQVADMVILLHRPDAFERDDPRMGEADLMVAKHRDGPTATITVAHQLHYSRFVDMAQE